MKNIKYKGVKINLNPNSKNSKIIYLTDTERATMSKYKLDRSPLFLFTHNSELYFGICNYTFSLFETCMDWKLDGDLYFNDWQPGKKELNYLMKLNPEYYIFDYNKTIVKGDLDNFSDYELNILKTAYREFILENLIKKEDH